MNPTSLKVEASVVQQLNRLLGMFPAEENDYSYRLIQNLIVMIKDVPNEIAPHLDRLLPHLEKFLSLPTTAEKERECPDLMESHILPLHQFLSARLNITDVLTPATLLLNQLSELKSTNTFERQHQKLVNNLVDQLDAASDKLLSNVSISAKVDCLLLTVKKFSESKPGAFRVRKYKAMISGITDLSSDIENYRL